LCRTGHVGKDVSLDHFPPWCEGCPEPQAGHQGVDLPITPLLECIKAHRRKGSIRAQSLQTWGRQKDPTFVVEVAIRLLQMHTEKASSEVGGSADLVGGFVWGAMEDKNIIVDQARDGVRAIAFLATIEEVDLQGFGGEERQMDISEAPFHIEAMIVTERILSTFDEILAGAQCHIELIDLILCHMKPDLGIRVANIGRIQVEMIDQFCFRAQAVALEREVEEPYPFL